MILMLKKFIIRISCLFPILLFIVGVNYFIDNGRIFKSQGYVRDIVELLLSGKNVVNVSNHDDRLFQKYYVQGLRSKKDVIVLGSSCSQLISGGIFEGRSFFNASVVGARLEDLEVIYALYRQKDLLPRTLILGIDPWIFNKNALGDGWVTLIKEYLYLHDILGLPVSLSRVISAFIARYGELASFSYFQESLSTWRRDVLHGVKDVKLYSSDEALSDLSVKRLDGVLLPPKEFREKSKERLERSVACFINTDPLYQLGQYFRIDPILEDEFREFLDLIRRDGVEVLLFLPPTHPLVYQKILVTPQYRVVKEVEPLIRKIAVERGIKVIGSYDPAGCGIRADDFYDGMHLHLDVVDRILKNGLNRNRLK
jgi:hypothetical protein